MRTTSKILLICLLILHVIFILENKSLAKEINGEDYYKSKIIKLVVGYGPGGGFDTYARLLAPWIEKETGAIVVVENRPGAGGLVALNQVFREKPDGLTIMLVNGQGAALAQLLSLEGVNFDLLQIPWLGRIAAEPLVMMLSGKSTFQTIDDIKKSETSIKWGGGGKADAIADTAAFVSQALNLRSQIIIGYKGSKETSLAVMRGEVDGMFVTAATAQKYARGNKLRPIAVLARKPSSFFPDIPTLYEVGSPDSEGLWWLDFRAKISLIGRALITSPGTPQGQVDYLASIIKKILTDQEFLAESAAKGRTISYYPAEELYKLITETVGGLHGEQLERVKYVVLEKYYN